MLLQHFTKLLVTSHLEYASTVWNRRLCDSSHVNAPHKLSFYYHHHHLHYEGLIKCIEKVQMRTTKLQSIIRPTIEHVPYSDRLKALQLLT